MQKKHSSVFRSIALNLALLLGTILVLLLILEVFLRVSGIQEVFPMNPPIYLRSDDPAISYTLKHAGTFRAYASTVTTNSLGFRSPELSKGTSPLVLLGDSLVFGYGVQDDETLGARLQKLLPSMPVLSVGVNGYNIEQERAVYEQNIVPLHPKGLILVWMPNDMDETLVLDAEGYFRPKSDHSPLTYEQKLDEDLHQPGSLPIPFKTFFQLHSATFTFLERATKSLPFRFHVKKNSVFEDPITDAQRSLYAAQFDRLMKSVGKTPMLMVIWPEENLHLTTRAFLKQLAEKYHVAVLDLYEIYGNHYDSLRWDGHPNAATLAKTAGILSDAIEHNPSFQNILKDSSAEDARAQ